MSQASSSNSTQLSLEAIESAAKELALSGYSDSSSYTDEVNRQLNLVTTAYQEALDAFTEKMAEERGKIETLLEQVAQKETESLQKHRDLTDQLPRLRKVNEMPEIESEQRRKIQNTLIDQELTKIQALYQAMSNQVKELSALKSSSLFTQAQEIFEGPKQEFTEALRQVQDRILVFHTGFAKGKAIYDDIQAIEAPAGGPPPSGGPGTGDSGSTPPPPPGGSTDSTTDEDPPEDDDSQEN